MVGFFLVLVVATFVSLSYAQNQTQTTYQHQSPNELQQTVSFGPCRFVFNPQCPDPDVTFFMYSTAHPESPEPIYIAPYLRGTNLAKTSFDPAKPTKVVIHGYNSNMFLSALTELRKEYLKTNDYNIFAVDWSPLNRSPCYPAAVWNARHVGTCTSQLLERIREMGATDIHVIGFSLGAHISNYLAVALRPYKLPKITGLDPALPGFITASLDEKLDQTDAEFVDVYHTNAFMQGKAEESGHVDFYFNGGSIQPGCWGTESFFSCNHHRAPLYYAESINSNRGFWGWKCYNFFHYLTGHCPPNEIQIPLGNNIRKDVSGTYMVITSSAPPFAIGRYNTSFSINRLKLTDESIYNNIENGVTSLKSPILKQYQQEILYPSTLEEHEMFNQVSMDRFGTAMDVQNEVFMNDYAIFQDLGSIYDNRKRCDISTCR